MSQITERHLQIFGLFLSDKKIVIADSSSVSRTYIAKLLVEMGAKTTNIQLTPTFEEAETLIEKYSPKVVICDYNLGKKCGLDLLQRQVAKDPKSDDRLFVLVTANSSQSAVAQAAEEDVDTFILKPFTADILKKTILSAAVSKLSPPPYLKAIQQGRSLIEAGKLDEAEKKMREATTLDKAPSLALAYLGQIDTIRELLSNAETKFQSGLTFNKIHYKCMAGLFDVLQAQKRHKDAYAVVKRISQYFPANPQRLTQVLKLAIMTKSYDDVETYYQSFKNIDKRNEEMVRYVCAALVVCGKYYLHRGIKSRAVELFQGAVATSGAAPRMLREIIQILLEFKLAKQAGDFLKRFAPDVQNGLDAKVSEFLIMDQTEVASRTVGFGRKLLDAGHKDPWIYKRLIARSAEAGLKSAAEDLVHEASKLWPNRRAEFEKDAVAKSSESASTPSSGSSPAS